MVYTWLDTERAIEENDITINKLIKIKPVMEKEIKNQRSTIHSVMNGEKVEMTQDGQCVYITKKNMDGEKYHCVSMTFLLEDMEEVVSALNYLTQVASNNNRKKIALYESKLRFKD